MRLAAGNLKQCHRQQTIKLYTKITTKSIRIFRLGRGWGLPALHLIEAIFCSRGSVRDAIPRAEAQRAESCKPHRGRGAHLIWSDLG